ncbi:MAG: ABC transporter substrate-binding protein [Oscillospiraceae bacterium]|nr:ABC transporter substrate-binding protein [Oscillospiraceae bacterium]
MNVKKLLIIFLAFVMLLSLCACGAKTQQPTEPKETVAEPAQAEAQNIPDETEAESAEVTVTDMIGREVTIVPGSYTRVVCIGAGALRMYSYIGDVALLAGVEDIDNTTLENRPMMFDSVARPYVLAYGEIFNTLPSCGVGGPMAQAAEAEKILFCNPDIVISEFEDVEKSDALQEQLGVPVITLSAGSKGVFDDKFYGSMELLSKVFAEEEKAATLVQYVQDEAAAISARVAEISEEEKPSVYICGLGNWGTTDHLMTAENYVSFEVAGVKNVLSGLGIQGVGPIEEEKFVELGEQMDIIIMDAAAVKNIKPLYAEDPTMFDTCKAWKNNEVYLEMAYNAYYTNYEIALINTWFIAKTVYPEAFADIDLTAKTNEVTQAFFGMDLADAIFACPSSFGGYQKIDTATFFG